MPPQPGLVLANTRGGLIVIPAKQGLTGGIAALPVGGPVRQASRVPVIAYAATTPDPNGVYSTALIVSARDGSGKRTILHRDKLVLGDLSHGFLSPVPSPDGKQVVFTDQDDFLAVVPATGSGSSWKPLAVQGADADWSPDGRWILFSRIRRTDSEFSRLGLWKMHPDGSGLTRVTSGDDDRPRWSADGRRILFRRARQQWFIASASGKHLQEQKILSLSRYVEQTDWSPDGKWLVCAVTQGPMFNPGLWLQKVNDVSGEGGSLLERGDVTAVDWVTK